MSDIPTAMRTLVKDREKNRCLRCGVPGTDIQHRMRRREGGHHLWNLVFMCHACHMWAHANPALARPFGWVISVHNRRPETVPLYTYYGEWITLTPEGTYAAASPPPR